MTMYTGLARIARLTGYPVVEVPGWRTRTRPQDMQDVRTITCHHTANGGARGDYPSYNTVLHGRGSELPGPLAQYGIGRSGTIYVFAAGSANHAGISRSVDYEKVHAIGIEAEAVGVPGAAGDWPEVQMDAYAKLCKALIKEFGLSVSDVRGHKETCSPPGRKSDPSFNMDAFRRRVSNVKLGPEPTTEEDIVASAAELRAIIREELTRPANLKVIAEELFSADVIKAPDVGLAEDPKNEKWQLRSFLNRILSNTEPPTPAP